MGRNSKANQLRKKKNKADKLKNDRAFREARKKKIGTIYLDESGNTGSNLIDKNQPIFVLSSISLSDAESLRLLKLIDSNSPREVHFKNLRRRRSGQDAIVRLLKHPLINKRNVKVSVFYKQFMILTKIVDLLLEHMAHLSDFDLYMNGTNIALSNMLHYCIPAFCGESEYLKLLENFVKMIREQSDENIEAFYSLLESLKDRSSHEEFKSDINMLYLTKHVVKDALDNIDKSALDPAIPAFFSACVRWGKEFPSGFHAVHDDSWPVEAQTELFKQFMDWTQDKVTLGYDRRKFDLPLKARSLKFESSANYSQLQVADIVASSVCYWANGVANGESEDYFFLELDKLNLNKYIEDLIWPSQDVTPKDLKTEYQGGLNAADHSAYFLMRARSGNSA